MFFLHLTKKNAINLPSQVQVRETSPLEICHQELADVREVAPSGRSSCGLASGIDCASESSDEIESS